MPFGNAFDGEAPIPGKTQSIGAVNIVYRLNNVAEDSVTLNDGLPLFGDNVSLKLQREVLC